MPRSGVQDGFITLDFIFAFTIAMGFTVVFFALAMTFCAVEITQYITYATARAANGAHFDPDAQVALGNRKFDELSRLSAFRPIYRNGWYKLGKPEIRDFNDQYPQTGTAATAPVFWGARVPFHAEVLDLKIPFLGQSKTQDTTGKATFNAYLMREPSNVELREEFHKKRFNGITGSSAFSGANAPPIIIDNGG